MFFFLRKNKFKLGYTWLHFCFCLNTCKTFFRFARVQHVCFGSTHGYTWLHMATHGYTWLHMATHGYTWLHMATHGYTCKTRLFGFYTWLHTPNFFWDHQLHSVWFPVSGAMGGINVWHIIPICFSNKPFHTYFNLIILQAFIFDQVSDVIICNVFLQFVVRPNWPQENVTGLISKFEYIKN